MTSCFILVVYFFSWILWDFQQSLADDVLDFQKELATKVVWAAQGQDAELPCDLTAPPGDRLNMVLWFKDSTGIPLYSLDSRTGDLTTATHWAISDELGTRSYFLTNGGARLRIARVTAQDEGVFRCRVDFFNSPTRNFRVNLTLVVSPESPTILDGKGDEVAGVAGPFLEGYDLQLSCHVTGGRPQPEVTWWQEGLLIDDISESVREGAVVNRLFLSSVQRGLRGATLECRATSIPAPPVIRRVALEVYLKPLNVKIVTSNEVLSAGKSRQLLCESTGSVPPARLSWLLDGEPIKHAATVVADSINSTKSVLTLRPDVEDDRKELACRSENPHFPGGILEDRRFLRIAYPPVVSVTLGTDVDPENLKEGDDVRLTCEIRANPEADKIIWYHGTQVVFRNDSTNGRVLTIQGIRREDAGEYVCVASNKEGAARSRALFLSIQFAPVCKPGTEEVAMGAMRHETLEARCEVLASPGGSTLKFSWTYSKGRDVLPIPASRIVHKGHVSTIQYAPVSETDFGTLACWATNPVGRQLKPCLISIVHAKRPDPPRSCELRNSSSTGRLDVVCEPGSNGGLIQHFILEVCEAGQDDQARPGQKPNGGPLYRLLGPVPRFTLHSLQPDTEYRALVYAKNAMGSSEPPVSINGVKITAAMAKLTRDDALASQGKVNMSAFWTNIMSNVIIAGIGAITCVILITFTTFIACRVRNSSRRVGRTSSNLNNVPDHISKPSRESLVEDQGGGISLN
ncbi:motor axon guidance molcule sidestep [Lycorma delicatula]|uniref:motor axon guidance molcule sidestep n=1 Tax=Lycorma delicatula TaxID=130591 RepID=UPI003F516031